MHQDGPPVSAKTCGRAVAYLQDILTLTSHTTEGKTPTDHTLKPPAGSTHGDAVIPSQAGGQHQDDGVVRQRDPGDPDRGRVGDEDQQLDPQRQLRQEIHPVTI